MKYKVGDRVISGNDPQWETEFRNRVLTIKSIEKGYQGEHYLMEEFQYTEWYDFEIIGLDQSYAQQEEAKKLLGLK